MPPRSLLVFAGAVVLASVFAGCDSLPRIDGARQGPFYTPVNVRGTAQLPANIRRIAILPVAGVSAVPEESLARLDVTFVAELNRAARAETIPVSRETLDRLVGVRQVDSTTALPAFLLSKLQAETSADAVLFVDITTFSAYPPIALGIRAKLVTVNGLEMLWAFDNTFDAQEATVANAARRHFLSDPYSSSHVADLSPTVLQNPARFATYAAAATFATLPAR